MDYFTRIDTIVLIPFYRSNQSNGLIGNNSLHVR